MSVKFTSADIAVARGIRALESAHGQTILASADLLRQMIAAGDARALPAQTGQIALEQVGELVAGAIRMRRLSVDAHQAISDLGSGMGLPVKALGDGCQDGFAQLQGQNVTPMRAAV